MINSTKNYRTLVELASDGFIIYDLEGKIIDFNESACHFIGYAADELRQLRLTQLFFEEEIKERPIYFEGLQKGKETIDIRRIKRKDGSGFFAEIRSKMLEDGSIMALARDITERRNAEEELRLSEERWKFAWEGSNDGIWDWDIKSRKVYVSVRGKEIFGYSADDEFDHYDVWRKRLHPDDTEAVLAKFKEHFEGRTPFYIAEHRALCKDGNYKWVLVKGKVVTWTPDGTPARMIGSHSDISERKTAEQALHLSNERFSMIGKTINDAVFDWDLETNKIWWNESHYTLFGFDPEKPIPTQVAWLEKIHPDDRHLLSKTYDPDPVSNRQSWSQQIRFLRHDGTFGTLFHRSVALFNEEKRPVRLMGAFTDITGVKAAEEKLKKNYDQLQAIANLTEAVSRATNLPDIYELALDALTRTIGADRASVLLFDANDVMRFKASRGLSDEYRSHTEGHTPWSKGEKDAQPILVTNVEAEPSLAGLLNVITDEGIAALGFIPLVFNQQLLGKFMIYYNHCHEFGEEEIRLLNTIAREVAFAIAETQSQIALLASEQRYRDVINNVKEVLFQTDKNANFLFLNPAWAEITGYEVNDSIGHSITEFIYIEDLQHFLHAFEAVIDRKVDACKQNIRIKTNSGTIRWFEINKRLNLDETGKSIGTTGTLNDITERKIAEEAIVNTTRQLRQLAAHLQEVREEERTMIAREIHDELGQQLTVIKMDLSWLTERIMTDQPLVNDKLNGVSALLDNVIRTVRRLSSELHPSLLDDLGLVATIDWHLHDFENRSGIKTEFSEPEEEPHLPPPVKTGLYRIFQESLTNVLRHAQATAVKISLTNHDGQIALTISDNGKGFDSALVYGKKTLGLLSMKERTMLMGGEYTVLSRPGEGTTVIVTLNEQNQQQLANDAGRVNFN